MPQPSRKPVAMVTRPDPIATQAMPVSPTPIVEQQVPPRLYAVPRAPQSPPVVTQPARQPVVRQPAAPATPKEPTGIAGRNSSDKVHAYNVWLHSNFGQLVADSWMPKNAAKFRYHVKTHPPKLVYSPADAWQPNPNYQKGQSIGQSKSIGYSPTGRMDATN